MAWMSGVKALKPLWDEKGIQPNWIYSSEEADAPQYLEHLGIETVLIDPKRTFMNISGALIRENPFRYWDYIPTEVKPFFRAHRGDIGRGIQREIDAGQ